MNQPEWLKEVLDSFNWSEHGIPEFQDNFITEEIMDIEDILRGGNSNEMPASVTEFSPDDTSKPPQDYFSRLVAKNQREDPEKVEEVPELAPQTSSEGFPLTSFPNVDQDVQGAIMANINDPAMISACLSVQSVRNQEEMLKRQNNLAELVVKLLTTLVTRQEQSVPAPEIKFGE